jgi:hypothetical protein
MTLQQPYAGGLHGRGGQAIRVFRGQGSAATAFHNAKEMAEMRLLKTFTNLFLIRNAEKI